MAEGNIPIQCKCGAKMNAPAAAAGRTAKCPKCGGPIKIPGGPAAKPAPQPAPKPKPPPPPAEEPEEEEEAAEEEAPAKPTRTGRLGARGRASSRSPRPAAEPGERTKGPTIGAVFGILLGVAMLGCGGVAGFMAGLISDALGQTSGEVAKTEMFIDASCDQCGFAVSGSPVLIKLKNGDACTTSNADGSTCTGTWTVTEREMTEEEKATNKEAAEIVASGSEGSGMLSISGYVLLGAGFIAVIAGLMVLKRKKLGKILTLGAIVVGLGGAGVAAAAHPAFLIATAPVPALYAIISLLTIFGSKRAAEFS